MHKVETVSLSAVLLCASLASCITIKVEQVLLPVDHAQKSIRRRFSPAMVANIRLVFSSFTLS